MWPNRKRFACVRRVKARVAYTKAKVELEQLQKKLAEMEMEHAKQIHGVRC